MNISFGKKIPIMHCQVQNKETEQFVPATVYEYDCKSKNDALDIDAIDGYWIFKPEVFYFAKDKCSAPNKHQNEKFYSLEVGKGNTLGLMMCTKKGEENNIDVLESRYFGGHRFVGTALITAAAMETLKGNLKKLTVDKPIKDVLDFYIDDCGFKKTDSRQIEMNNAQLKQFIKQTEEKTKAPIIDLRG